MDRKKLARSNRKKIELIKECKEKLFGMEFFWKETPDDIGILEFLLVKLDQVYV